MRSVFDQRAASVSSACPPARPSRDLRSRASTTKAPTHAVELLEEPRHVEPGNPVGRATTNCRASEALPIPSMPVATPQMVVVLDEGLLELLPLEHAPKSGSSLPWLVVYRRTMRTTPMSTFNARGCRLPSTYPQAQRQTNAAATAAWRPSSDEWALTRQCVGPSDCFAPSPHYWSTSALRTACTTT